MGIPIDCLWRTPESIRLDVEREGHFDSTPQCTQLRPLVRAVRLEVVSLPSLEVEIQSEATLLSLMPSGSQVFVHWRLEEHSGPASEAYMGHVWPGREVARAVVTVTFAEPVSRSRVPELVGSLAHSTGTRGFLEGAAVFSALVLTVPGLAKWAEYFTLREDGVRPGWREVRSGTVGSRENSLALFVREEE